MKRFVPFIALLALVALVGCSADSPSAKPVPTVVPESWGISSLTASDTGPYVGTVILVEAAVTKNGAAAPDTETVTFQATGGAFSSGSAEASANVSGGTASVAYFSDVAGTFEVRALFKGVSSTITITYRDRAVTDELQLFDVNPRRGSYAGGEEALITGKGILAPVEVYFDVAGVAYQAIVAAVSESNPPSDPGSVTVVTPNFTGADTSIEQAADVRVIVGAGTGSAQSDTLTSAYVLLPSLGPMIYGVSPSSGRSSGGEVVNVLGQGFGSVASDLAVTFVDPGGVAKVGTILSVSPDGSQIQVETPLFSTIPLASDVPYDVNVSTLSGPVSLPDGFLVLADEPTPVIASISPTSGPLDGGTLVTIFGSGFQIPMQVKFGTLTALDVNVFNDTTPADNDRITCVTPDYSFEPDVPPVTVDVKATNMTSGKSSTLSAAYRYGDPLFITGNTPSVGQPGDLVIIYGSGFEDPLQVFFPSGGSQMNVVSVSGTELVVQIPPDYPVACGSIGGSFKVTLLETGQTTTGGTFSITGNSPIVLSVDPVILNETSFGDVDPDAIMINGHYFADEVLVRVGIYQVPSSNVTVVSEATINVENLPDTTLLGITFDTTTSGCISPQIRDIPTPVSVAVTNFPGACADTLTAAIVVEPYDTACYDPPP
jgi:hypothetical protein